MVREPTHYDVLGVSPDASGDVIRGAYRDLARRHHPDRAGDVGHRPGAMSEINEAYRVLNDPARRAVYDAGLRNGVGGDRGTSAARAAAADRRTGTVVPPPGADRPRPLEPARVPWRSLLFFGLLAVVGVFVLAQFTEPGEDPGPDGILRTGDCVEIEPDGDAREVRCTGQGDLVVSAFVAFDAPCPNGTEPHRDRQGMGVACVERPR